MRIISLFILLFTPFLFAGPAEDADFSKRCAAAGVVWCLGFDDQNEVNKVTETRYAASSGETSQACGFGNPCAKAYPDNIDPNQGLRYPAVDPGQAKSGTGSLRLTANPIGDQNQSGSLMLGTAAIFETNPGASDWSRKFGAGETLYVQFRARYDASFVNMNWGAIGGSGVKQFIFWRDGGSCSDLEFTLVDTFSRGYPQAYTNCGANGFVWYPPNSGADTQRAWNTNYPPASGHVQILYQMGPNQGSSPSENDFLCMRDFETSDTCSFFKNHENQWWTYYFELKIGEPNSLSPPSHVNGWVSRGGGEPMRQFLDYSWPWTYQSGKTIENFMFTLYDTDKSSGNHPEATAWFDELIISSLPIATPSDVSVVQIRPVSPPNFRFGAN